MLFMVDIDNSQLISLGSADILTCFETLAMSLTSLCVSSVVTYLYTTTSSADNTLLNSLKTPDTAKSDILLSKKGLINRYMVLIQS